MRCRLEQVSTKFAICVCYLKIMILTLYSQELVHAGRGIHMHTTAAVVVVVVVRGGSSGSAVLCVGWRCYLLRVIQHVCQTVCVFHLKEAPVSWWPLRCGSCGVCASVVA